jgi:antitoxin component of MazEF toxin-antitoxin module
MGEAKIPLGEPRTVSKRGGSLVITIPNEIIEVLRLTEGDKVQFVLDKKSGEVSIIKAVEYITITHTGEKLRGRPLTESELKRLLESLRRGKRL